MTRSTRQLFDLSGRVALVTGGATGLGYQMAQALAEAGAAVALATGRELYGTATGAACFTGAWTASVFGSAGPGELGSWAGDADEALDLIRARPGAGFDELARYSDGFHGGRAACG